jgi:hypothetical protein
MGIALVKIDKKTHPRFCMEIKDGLCWDHKQIECIFNNLVT